MIHKIHLGPEAPQLFMVEPDGDLVVTIDSLDDAQLHDAASVSRQSRQFNASAHHYTDNELHEFRVKPDHYVLGVRIANRSHHFGLIGCLVCHADEEDFIADGFILADPFLGYGIEQAMIKTLSDHALSCGCAAVVLRLARSVENQAARAFYDSLGLDLEALPSGELEVAFASLSADDILARSETRTRREKSQAADATLRM